APAVFPGASKPAAALHPEPTVDVTSGMRGPPGAPMVRPSQDPFERDRSHTVLNAIAKVPAPENEPIHSYAPGTPERDALKAALRQVASEQVDIPVVIGGKEIRTGNLDEVRMPHRHEHVLAKVHQADASHVQAAI